MKPDAVIVFRARRFSVVRQIYRTRDGHNAVREWSRHPGAVTIVPLLDDDRVCLIRNVRVPVDQTLIELPAGTLEKDEAPEATAARELVEETGYRAASLVKLHEFYMSPGVLDERMHLFVATGLTPGAPAREAGEEIENLLLSWRDAMAMIDDGRIQDAKTLVGLLFYDRLRQRGEGG